MFPKRFTRIDDLTRSNHHFLSEDDECFFMGEYTARGGPRHSTTNQLIWNLKIPMDCRDTGRWHYKTEAIQTAAGALRGVLSSSLERVTFVPVPPSKHRSDDGYDPRLTKVLSVMGRGLNLDCREIIFQTISQVASHVAANQGENRTDIDDLINCYEIDHQLISEPREIIGVFDDVITTGRHFVAMKCKLKELYPNAQIVGFFLARVVPNSTLDFES